jgi:large subunit ribosomal protein L23
MNPYDIVRSPLVTEKTTLLKEQFGQIAFEVDSMANRIEIKHAVEEIFKVRVVRVKTMNVKGKVKRVGRNLGKRKDRKKAIITLAHGEQIEFFEGV